MKKHIFLIAAVCAIAAPSVFAQSAPAEAAFRQEGIGSWYGAEFEGRPTASGEIFDSRQLTAAHPTLPFGTRLLVTNGHNGKSVVVRVNDRGPFVAARIIDISRGAAEKLDMVLTGTAPVTIKALPEESAAAALPNAAGTLTLTIPADPDPASAPIAPTPEAAASGPTAIAGAEPAIVLPKRVDPASNKRYRLQVGAYRIAKHATEAFDRLKAAELPAFYEKNGELYRVVIAEVPAADVDRIAALLGKSGFREVLAREIR